MTTVLYPLGLYMCFDKPGAGFKSMSIRENAGMNDDILQELRDMLTPLAHDAIIVFQGGEDINPELYGEKNMYSHFNKYRDAWEKICWTVSQELGIPFIGICRGHQLVAALNGGSLYQDLRTQVGMGHRSEHKILFTDVATTSGFTGLMQSCPTGSPDVVNSYHHQAVKRVPENAQVLALSASDRVVEALLYPNGITVQWHPEFLGHREFLAYVKDKFIDGLHNKDGRGDRDGQSGAIGAEAHGVVVTVHDA